MSKRAVILAGGMGSRLKPYTVVLPKPLMPLGDYSILEIIIRQLAKNGFDHITLAVNHQANIIMALFGDGNKWNVKIDYSLEDRPLSTIAPLKLINALPQNFLVMNGDILTDLNYKHFYEEHVARENLFTISSFEREHQIDFGVLEFNKHNVLTDFKEKPISLFQVSMGIYMINRDVLEIVPNGQLYGFDHLMRDLLAKKDKVIINKHNGYWLDIGRPDDYTKAIEEFEKMKHLFI